MPDAPPAPPPPKPPEQPQQPPPAPPPPAEPSPPPTAPPAPTPPPAAEAPKDDKVLASIYKTFGVALDDEFRVTALPDAQRLKDTDPAPPPAVTVPPQTTTALPPTATPPPQTTTALPATATPPAQPSLEVKRLATDEILELQKKVRADLAKFDKRLDELPKAPPAPPPATPPPDTFEAGLPEENRETIELLRWAEENKQEGFNGAAANYVAYLKRLEEFTRSNPEEEEVVEFQQKNKPPITEAAVRKVAREKIKAEAKAEARKEAREELSPELNELRRKQYELEIKPVLAEASREFRLRFADEKAKLPEGVERIDPVAAREVMQGGEAANKHKVILPILRFHAAMADEYMDLSLGMKPYDQNNQMHRFLDRFIFHQEQVLLKASPAKQIRNGKQFLPTIKYQEAFAKDAADTEARFWMFSHDDVRRMIEINAHKQVSERRKEIAEAAKSMGFAEPAPGSATNPPQTSQTAKPIATNPPQTPPPAGSAKPPEPPSPRSAPGKMPGAAQSAGLPTPLQQAASSVYPQELLATVK